MDFSQEIVQWNDVKNWHIDSNGELKLLVCQTLDSTDVQRLWQLEYSKMTYSRIQYNRNRIL